MTLIKNIPHSKINIKKYSKKLVNNSGIFDWNVEILNSKTQT